MENIFTVSASGDGDYATMTEALVAAQRKTQKYSQDYAIYQMVKIVKYPVPTFEVIDV